MLYECDISLDWDTREFMDKQKILIIDDAKDLREAMTDILELKGYNVVTADRGESGVATALSEHPDLILLDLRMPDIDGFEVIRKVRENDWGKTAKILILTASGESDEIPKDIEMSIDDFLLKTEWGLDNIAIKIREKLEEQPSSS
jgi:two-component system alkaline phosphatase synthesis response regulator PhoP